MFKKIGNRGDKIPKQEGKENTAKAEAAANPLGPTAEKTAAPANEAKKS